MCRTTAANGCDLIQSQWLTTTLQYFSEQEKQNCCKVHTFWAQPNVFWEKQMTLKFHCQPLNWFETAFWQLGPSAMSTVSNWAHTDRSYTAYAKHPKPSCPVSPSAVVKRINPNDGRGSKASGSRWGGTNLIYSNQSFLPLELDTSSPCTCPSSTGHSPQRCRYPSFV